MSPSRAEIGGRESAARFPWAWLGMTLALVLVRALPNLSFPVGRDQATYCLIGQGLWDGQLLYRDLWDNKPPGVFFVYAVVVRLSGPVMWSVGMLDILLLLANSYLLFRFAQRYLGTPAAAVGTIVGAAWHCSASYVHASQPEGLLLLFILSAYSLLGPREKNRVLRAFAAGLLLGAAFWTKYTALAFFPLVALAPYLEFTALDEPRRRLGFNVPLRDLWLRTCALGAGLAVVSVGILAYFLLSGAWAAFREAQFEVLLRYGTMGLERSRLGLEAASEVYRQLGPWNEAAVAVALVIAWAQRGLARMLPVALAIVMGLAAALLPGRFHPYYFETVFPFLALCWGYVGFKMWGGFKVLRDALTQRSWRMARGLSWLMLANMIYALALSQGLYAVRDYQLFAKWVDDPRGSYAVYNPQHPLEKLADQLRVIDYLKANSAADDMVYVWGTAPLINFLAQRRSPGRFVSNLGLISPWGPRHWRVELMRELEAKRPRFVVAARHDAIPKVSETWKDSEQFLEDFPPLATLISSRYDRAVNFQDFAIYRLK